MDELIIAPKVRKSMVAIILGSLIDGIMDLLGYRAVASHQCNQNQQDSDVQREDKLQTSLTQLIQTLSEANMNTPCTIGTTTHR